ncbi:adenosylcobinamide-phosphate synthase CbiB [Jannaschia sp. Os4]|uniref:adenosylcobinamide-phosphate synthase CbiB n=1 Tax=Jannaschia sp. Os4 TaxID=2807617 RepID=UPI0031B59684
MLTLALLLDGALGEPRWLWSRAPHPAVLMGRGIEALDRRLNRGSARRAKGILALALHLALWGGAGWAVAAIPDAGVLEVAAAAILLAQRSLADHVAAVATALRRALPEGRAAVAMIVGRDTAAMDEAQVARAAIESAAENLSDGVVAPAFWFAVGGLPALAAYKALNTADSTIGYLTPRHAAFGWAAARLDDVANWIPARLTAALILLLHRAPWRGVAAEAHRHRSPNAGWPEAAAARALGVAVSGPRSYGGVEENHPFVNPEGARSIGPAEVDRAVALLWRVWWALVALSVPVSALRLL